jgi:nucleoside-diphosphate-sugar epimerase
MDVFVTGGSGFIGGSVAVHLARAGLKARVLVRTAERADAVARLGLEPVVGDLDDRDLLVGEARRANAVVNAASSDHRGAAEALVEGLEGSGKALLHTSGSSVVGDDARGEPTDRIFDEDSLPAPTPDKAARVAIDRYVLGAAALGVRSVVLCNSLIYGAGLGPHAHSIQIPSLVRQARKSGVVRHVGRGLNIWSTVHVEDMADLYLLALEKAEPGTFLFVEHGESSFRDMATAIAQALGLEGPEAWPMEAAIAEWGRERATYALGSNSRVRAKRARAIGWAPRRASVLDWIASGELAG